MCVYKRKCCFLRLHGYRVPNPLGLKANWYNRVVVTHGYSGYSAVTAVTAVTSRDDKHSGGLIPRYTTRSAT